MIGTGIGGLGSLEEQVGVLRERGPSAVSPLSVPLMMGNAAAAAVAMRHGIHGQTYGVVSACAAGAHAIGAAMRMIQAGDADAVVCGGAEATLTPIAIAAFGSMAATSPDRHLAPVRRPPRRLRDGRGRGRRSCSRTPRPPSSGAPRSSASSSATPPRPTPTT